MLNYIVLTYGVSLKGIFNNVSNQCIKITSGFPGSDGKAFAHNAGDPSSIPGSGRSPGEGNGNPLQDSYLENPMDRGAWRSQELDMT